MSRNSIDPYIGITDFTDKSQVEAMLAVLKRVSSKHLIRKLGVGVMMSRKTLNGLPSRFSEVFPAKEKIADIFVDDPLAYNVLHYADYEGIDVLENLTKAVKWGGPNLHAIQLDMIWPDCMSILKFKWGGQSQIDLILQINPSAMKQVNYETRCLADSLDVYHEELSAVLLDMSMGQGKPMSWLDLLPHLAYLNQRNPGLGLAVAGGLGPDSLNLVKPLVDCFVPEISIDAQGKLRPSGSYLDPIDWQMAEEYLVRAMEIFQRRLHQI
mgnify:CR=1 FL=1